MPDPSKWSTTKPLVIPVRVKRPDESVVVESPDPITVTLIPALTAVPERRSP